jgi:hypothetical protein
MRRTLKLLAALAAMAALAAVACIDDWDEHSDHTDTSTGTGVGGSGGTGGGWVTINTWEAPPARGDTYLEATGAVVRNQTTGQVDYNPILRTTKRALGTSLVDVRYWMTYMTVNQGDVLRVDVTGGGKSAWRVAQMSWTTSSDPPMIASTEPGTGPPEGGNLVTLRGTGFRDDAVVMFGAAVATEVTFVSATELRVRVPPARSGAWRAPAPPASGRVTVLVHFPDGSAGELPAGYRYESVATGR